MGQVHAMNYLREPGLVETVAICDTNAGNIQAMRKVLGDQAEKVKVLRDYHALLAMPEIEAVVVSTPNNTHRDIVIDAFAAGKHVFCEKPMEVTAQRCADLLNAWRQSDRILQIGLVYRYSPIFRTMAGMIAEGRIGTPCLAWCHEFREPFPVGREREWRYLEADSGGALVEKDCHHFDLFNWLLDARLLRVQAMGGQLAIRNDGTGEMEPGVSGEPYPGSSAARPEVLDHAWVNLEYEGGKKAHLGLCLFAPGYDLPVGVLGTRGRLVANVNKQTVEMVVYDRRGGKHKREIIEARTGITGFGQTGHSGGLDQHIEFCRCIREGKPAFCDGQVGLESLYPAFAAQRSIAEGGRVVEIKEVIP